MNTITTPALTQNVGPKLSGYMKTAYSTDTAGPDAMTVSNARVKLSGAIDDMTAYAVFFDAIRDDILLDAYVARKITSTLDVQAGQFKTPYGTDNLLPGWRYPFLNRSYLKTEVSPPFRDIGVQVTAHSRYLEVCMGVLNGSGPNKTKNNSNKNMVYRVAGNISPMLNISANYSRGVITGDGAITEFYDIGAGGLWHAVSYDGEYSCRKLGGVTSSVAAGWIACDLVTGLGPVPVITPAVRYEYLDPDTDSGGDAVIRYTVGMCVHFNTNISNRIMMNYNLVDTNMDKISKGAGIEYMVRY